jgi:hypothetical protein
MANDEILQRIESKLDQMLRLMALEATTDLKQARAIQLLADAGFERKLISVLLGTTPNTVSVTLSKSKIARTKGENSSGDK